MPRSLNARILVAAGAVLIIFLGVAGLAINHAFRDNALASVQERLKAQIFMLLSLANLDPPATEPMPETLPDLALSVPDSGHYAQIFAGAGQPLWRSRSMLGLGVQPPPEPPVGEFVFQQLVSSAEEPLFCLSYSVLWEAGSRARPASFVLQVCEARRAYALQVAGFQRSVSLWFGFLAGFLLLVQTLILRWGLRPLRAVAIEVRAIEAGRQTAISGQYPRELRALTRNLNALIAARDSHLQRYRHALGDLAHSLKTPLAVIRSTLDAGPLEDAARHTLQDQVAQLNDTVRYQLQRAATVGRHAFAPPIEVSPVLERIADSLRKVYHARNLEIVVKAAPESLFYGDQGDLMEVVGNLADNACKWARSKVQIQAAPAPEKPGQRRRSLEILVQDNGPGLPGPMLQEVLRRGLRMDESTEGQGIGLSVVRDIVEEGYGGRLHLHSTPGETCVRAEFDFD